MDSEILDQLTILEKNLDSEVTNSKRGRKMKIDPKIYEVEENDVREKREKLVACVLSGNSKQYLGKEYTEQQINEMDCSNVNTLLNKYESVLSAQMSKSLGKSVINLYSNIACSVLGVGNQQELRTDLVHVPNFWGVAGSEDFASATLPTTSLDFEGNIKNFCHPTLLKIRYKIIVTPPPKKGKIKITVLQ